MVQRTETTQVGTKAQHFVLEAAVMVATRLSDMYTKPVTDTKAIAQAVKRQMGTWGPREFIQVFWGSTEKQMYYVYNCTISEDWGLEYKWVSPKRFIRVAAHALLCQEVAKLLVEHDCFQLPFAER